MDFIFMLTHHDQTVPNCLEVYDSLADIGLRHVGFKDVGVDKATLKELTRGSRLTVRSPMSKSSARRRKPSASRSRRRPSSASTACSAGRTSISP